MSSLNCGVRGYSETTALRISSECPRLDARLNHEELAARYALTEADHAFIRASSRGETGRLALAMLLKARQDLGCFPALEEVHVDTVAHLASQLGTQEISIASIVPESAPGSRSLYRYQAAVRAYLSATRGPLRIRTIK